MNKLKKIDWQIKREFKTAVQCEIPLIELNLELDSNGKPDKKSLLLTTDKLIVLSEELKKIKKTMQKVNNEL